MSCSPFDLRDYVFGELPSADARTVESHVSACAGCREELDRLRLTHTALRVLGDEEIPRRIAFVSDKVFESSRWQRFWQAGPRLAFASAGMLSAAILTHAIVRPTAQTAPVASVDTAAVEARVKAEVADRLTVAIRQAMAEIDERQNQKLVQVVTASEKRLDLERRADRAIFQENFEVLLKKVNKLDRESYNAVASVGLGASQ